MPGGIDVPASPVGDFPASLPGDGGVAPSVGEVAAPSTAGALAASSPVGEFAASAFALVPPSSLGEVPGSSPPPLANETSLGSTPHAAAARARDDVNSASEM